MLKYLEDKINKKRIELDLIVKNNWWEKYIPEYKLMYFSKEQEQRNILGQWGWLFLKLNKSLLLEFWELYIKEVFIHEYAHFVINRIYPTWYNWRKKIQPHWKEFKIICSYFWINWKATTNLFKESEIFKNKKDNRKYIYWCNCQEHKITTRRHNLIENKKKKYICKNCKNPLNFKYKEND